MQRSPMHKVVFWISLTLSASVGFAQITLEAGDARGARGSEIEIPILVHDAQQLGPVQFELVFDPAVLEALDADGGPLLNGAVASFVPRPGQLNIGAITNAPLSGEGVLVTARFRVKGGAGSETVVGLQNELAFEYGRLVDLLVDTEPGAFRVTGIPWPMLLAVAVAVLLLSAALVLWRHRRRSRKERLPRVGRSQSEGSSMVPVPAMPAASGGARFCRQCGGPIETGDRFCGGCGARLSCAQAGA